MNRSSTDPHGVRPDDPLERWRADSEAREREFAAARARRQREEQQRLAEIASANEAGRLRLEFESRLAALERGYHAVYEDLADVARATSRAIDDLVDAREELTRERVEEIKTMQSAIAKMDKTLDELRRGPAFQFAREREVEDLPNPLAGRKVN
jgi:hypothetical protein